MFITKAEILSILETVPYHEVPVLSIVDLGIVRRIEIATTVAGSGTYKLNIFITPTHPGSPAMDVINKNIKSLLLQHGFANVEIKTVLSPAWTTDWMPETARKKLKAAGIAPPNINQQVCTMEAFRKEEAVQCPHCNSYHTQLLSRFGAVACLALYKCNHCNKTFEYFKSY